MARIVYLQGQPDRPSSPSTGASQATNSQSSSAAMQSSARTVVYDSEDDDESIAVRPGSTKRRRQTDDEIVTAASDNDSAVTKQPRRKRMLLEVNADNILTPESVADDADDEDFTQQLRMSGLKAPTPDQGATRRSSRREARKPRMYNTRIHPQDYALPYRRSNIGSSMADGKDTPPGTPYKPNKDDDKQDTVRAPDESDIEIVDDPSIPAFPTPDPGATRRSRRSEAHKRVLYNMRIHPNDRDIGIYTGRTHKRPQQGPVNSNSGMDSTGAQAKHQSRSRKSKSLIIISDEAEHSDEDDNDSHSASLQGHEQAAEEGPASQGAGELFSELNNPKPIRHHSNESDTIVVRPALQEMVNTQFTTMTVGDELDDDELLDSFNNVVDAETIDEPSASIVKKISSSTSSFQLPAHRVPLRQGQQPQTSSMLVEVSQPGRLETPNIDDFHTMLTQYQVKLSPGRDATAQGQKRTSIESATLSNCSEKRVSNGSTLSGDETTLSLEDSTVHFRSFESVNNENRRPSARHINVVV